jgi:2-dehydro-3-deoxyphosphogluconate aldolase/(4S)-4-hydroxy-2-oxoglutarate aldolase
MSKQIIERISNIGIVPVVKIEDPEDALPLAKALYNGGIDTAEITFRSEHALCAMKKISAQLPDMLLGAGTVLNVEQAADAVQAGAQFIVTPGFNHEVVKWCIENNITVLPGISSASELETALSYGIKTVKFFPAESSGGAKKIKDLSAPYSDVKFLPTGGINESNMHDYLSLPCVLAIGGSFMIKDDLIANKDFAAIEELSRKAVKSMLKYELIHIGVNNRSEEEAIENAKALCHLFNFTYYHKPKSQFAGKGFEFLNCNGRGRNGHIAIYTPYPEKAIYHLNKLGIKAIEETITRNKKTGLINFVYLNLEIAGFAVHLINPDLKMEI